MSLCRQSIVEEIERPVVARTAPLVTSALRTSGLSGSPRSGFVPRSTSAAPDRRPEHRRVRYLAAVTVVRFPLTLYLTASER